MIGYNNARGTVTYLETTHGQIDCSRHHVEFLRLQIKFADEGLDDWRKMETALIGRSVRERMYRAEGLREAGEF